MAKANTREVLSDRALNRALLARQILLRRESRPVFDVVDHLVGMQAQVPTDPYIGLWSRLEPFDPADLEDLLLERKVARSPLMRGTIHLATAEDSLEVRVLVQPVLDRMQRSAFGKRLAGVDTRKLVKIGRKLLTERALTFAQLRQEFPPEWAEAEPQALGYSVSALVPLVQVPPRGNWSTSGQATWMTTEAWLGRPLPTNPSVERMVLRYLAAFGPATPADAQAWCGLTRLGAVFERLRAQLVTFADKNGWELFDLPDAPRPEADTPAPVRFLPQYDNVFLGHADRSRIVSAEIREQATRPNGYISMLLVDGFIAGAWKLERQGKKAATLQVSPLAPWSAEERAEVQAEAERLLAFLAPEAECEVVVSAPISD